MHAENLPTQGPAVFIANHLGPLGPIGVVCSIRLRFYPWIISEMLDKRLAADYMRVDFVEPSLGLRPPWSSLIARALSLITVPSLAYLGCVSIHRGEYEVLLETLQESLALLREGKCILIFPEEPQMELDTQTNMRPFLKGFTRLGDLYYHATKEILNFYPLAVHESKKVMVGKPIPFDPYLPHGLERHHLKDALENEIQAMYLLMDRTLPPSP